MLKRCTSAVARSRRVLGVIIISAVAMTPGLANAAEDSFQLQRVILSSGGVGYLEFAADVEGTADLALQVPLDQVDDVLKSIVVYDQDGGIGQVSLPGREPLAQVFRDLPFGPDALSAPDVLLNHLQGAEIRALGGRELEGRVLRVVAESTVSPTGNIVVSQRHRVTLVTDEGLQQFILEEAEAVEFLDPTLRDQVTRALTAIAENRIQDRRRLTIHSEGDGRREVRVGYVVEVPLWKASYRASLSPQENAAAAQIQGWAHIDNLSGHDWNGVELTLVSGNPVTFRQALYTAYFVDRPEVPVEVLGRILPRLDQGALVAMGAADGGQSQLQEFRRTQRKAASTSEMDLSVAEEAPAVSGAVMAQAPPPDPEAATRRLLAAASEEAATQVSFRIPRPVTVAKGQALMVPIIDRDLPATRLSVYQPKTHGRHPLASLLLTNDSESGLPPGSLTLYEAAATPESSYLGDARLAGLPTGEERLISFALDQKVTVDREDQRQQRISKGRINKGILELTYTVRQTTIYRVKAPAQEDRRLMVEHPRLAGWKLISPTPEQSSLTETDYRFEADLPAGSESKLEVVLEQPRFQTIALAQLSGQQLVSYAENGELDPKLREAIAKIGDLRHAIEQLDRRLAQLNQDRERLFQEQKRIRDNMARVPKDSDIYRRYLTKLDSQEDALETLLSELNTTQEERNAAQDALGDYVGNLTL